MGTATGATSPPARLPPRLRWLVAVVVALGVTVLAVDVVAAAHADLPAPWRLLLVAVVVLAGDLTVLHLRFGSDQYSFTWSEASVVLGLVIVPWPWLTLVAVPCVAVAHLVQRRALVKVAYNAAGVALGTMLAGLVALPLSGGGLARDEPRTWLALAAAGVAFSVWNTVSVCAAVAWSQDLGVWTVVRRGLLLKVLCLGGNVLGALLLVTLHWDVSSAATAPTLVLLLSLSYRGYLRAIEERDVWQQLDATSTEMSRLDEAEVAEAALRRAQQLFKAEWVELVLADVTGQGRRYRREGDVTTAVEGLVEVPDARPLPDAGPVVGGRAIVVPFTGLGERRGTLALGFRAEVRLTDRERQVLRTFMHTVGSSLRNVGLFETVLDQAHRSAHEAAHDALTGLANRSRLRDRMQEALEALGPQPVAGGGVALLLVDLDHFKEINDTLGHTAGDVLLRVVGRRLQESVRPGDTVARLGGDEFAVLLPDVGEAGTATARARDLLSLIAQPVVFEELRLTVEGSIGVALYPDDAASLEELLQRADVALYQAKTSRGSVQHYNSERDDSSVSRLALATELRAALASDQLVPHYQAKLSLADGRVTGVEALCRWEHPTRGLLPPAAFVGAVEQSGLVHAFTLNVLDRAVAQCAVWRADGHDLCVAVNLSARNLLDRDLPEAVAEVLDRHGLPASHLVLEITETVMMSELEVVEEILGRLRSLGVLLSVDDFGTGYSSLAFLRRVAVNELKVDRSFVSRMLASDNDRTIVRATVDLAHSLGLTVVAEGVEDQDVLEALVAMGCDAAQGYHIGRPQDAVATGELLARLGTRAFAVPAPRSAGAPERLAG